MPQKQIPECCPAHPTKARRHRPRSPRGPSAAKYPGAREAHSSPKSAHVPPACHPPHTRSLPPPTIPNPLAEARKHLKSTPLVDCTPPRLTWLASILSRPRSYGTAWRYDTAARRGGRAQMARYLSRYSSSALSSARDERTRRSAALR
eukprot:scaffold6513_cov62-Phaeocystis_antarctica.AAC.5